MFTRYMTIILATGALMTGAASGQDYPSGTVETIVPFSAGGGTDIVARAFQQPFADALGTTIVIRNVAGASGTVGATTAAQSKADGYTLGYLPIGPLAIQPVLRPVEYDADSWNYICQTTDNPVLLMVSNSSGIETIEDLVSTGSVIYGSSGPGTIPHLSMAGMTAAFGITGTHIPYDGTGPAMNALAGGEITAFADQPSVVRANDARPLLIFTEERHPDFPDVPTAIEKGQDLTFSIWQGIVTPKGVDPAIQETLARACKTALDSEAFRETAQSTNTELKYRDPAAFEEFVRQNTETNRRILLDAGLIK